MASNTFGTLFQITTFGESHGSAVGVTIDGCPAGVSLSEAAINTQLARRAPGKTPYTSPRGEKDYGRILSGVFNGTTTGAPITILIENGDADSSKYEALQHILRPGHANATYLAKYGEFDYRGGGRASARETAARVAAGAVAQALLAHTGIHIFACLSQVGTHTAGIPADIMAASGTSFEHAIQRMQEHLAISELFAPSPEAENAFATAIEDSKERKDSLGGRVSFFILNAPVGLGDPVYHKLSARLAYALMSIPATKGFEIGQGFASASTQGSLFNDGFTLPVEGSAEPSPNHTSATTAQNIPTAVRLKTNRAGGVLGGISTGDCIYGNLAFKPTSSIAIPQKTLSMAGEEATFLLPEGSRHDPCVAVRGVPVVEAMCWLVLADAWLMNRSAKVDF